MKFTKAARSSRPTITTPACALLALLAAVLCATAAAGAPAVRNVAASGSSAGIYEKFELTFDVDTIASKIYWPYDTAPNQGVPPNVGVTVDGLFSRDNWATTVVQPGFYFQDYERGNYLMAWKKRDWLYPKGEPCWKIRFAPTTVGEWRYKIRVTDSSGTTVYDSPSNVFVCTTSDNHGFVRVSPTDCRYFETSDGSYLNLMGLSDNVTATYDMDSLYSTYGANKINLLRPWWQGSQGPAVFGLSGQGGVPGWSNILVVSEATRPGQHFSGKIRLNEHVSTGVDVKPSTRYRYSVWVKTVNLQGSGDYGVYLMAFDCTQPDVPLTTKVRGTTDWTQLVATVETKSNQRIIDFLKIAMSGASSGDAYYTDVSVREDLGGGRYGPEQLPKPNFNSHQYVSQYEAWKADYQVECAKRNGIYLKVCLQEKADIVFGRIQADGSIGWDNENNVYASDTHASRTYQRYFWRYMIARYGYATSIHSWELVNEGDPFNANHHMATQAFAKFMHDNDPNRRLCTTSFWHSYPVKECWANPSYPNIGYSDWHQYVGLQSGNPLQYIYGWQRDSEGAGNSGIYPFTLDNTTYKSPPSSFYVNSTGFDARAESYPFAISPGHTYRISYQIKGRNLTSVGTKAGSIDWVHPTIVVRFKDGWWASELGMHIPGYPGESLGTYDWTPKSFTVTAPANARYMIIHPSAHWAVGECWFDDITIYDETAGAPVEVPNGNFDSARLDFDTALMTYSIGTQAGMGTSRAVRKPLIRGEIGISGNKVYGDVYKGMSYTGENQQLVDDTQGVWFKKLIWGHINPFGVIDMYWWRYNIDKNGLWKYARAYQNFMAGIPLSNGNYRDSVATTSTTKLRAWGQKDLTNNRAHLWIDNVPCNWKNVVDGVQVPAVSGTVTLSGLKDGSYKAEWWDTTTGSIIRTDPAACTGGNIALQVQGLQSDVACRIYPATTAAAVSMRVVPDKKTAGAGATVTVTVEFSNGSDVRADNVVITAEVPTNTTYVVGSAEATGGSYNAASRSVSWTISSIQAGQSGTRAFKVKLD